ncbi:LCP family protein [Bifidobacterium sp. MA2]|uniref:LCP family protein n=2 Tax=Bifidobacterium santillanense TaxID=2809028 RepID=A0ABS5UPZ9_9BIFI|nr:LCP family protein [Bifidobacterium santillanense]
MPASFAPRRRSTRRSSSPAPRTSGRSSVSSARTSAAAASEPRRFEPSRAPRRSSGSTSEASAARRGTTAPVSSFRSPAPSVRRAPSLRMPRLSAMSVRKGVGMTLAVIAVLLMLAVFGAWHWVDARLNKESGWLTTSANASAESWLILGSDERDGTAGGSADDTPGFRTDTILVLTRPNHGASSLISIPRDSLTQVDGTYMKINAVAQIKGYKALVGEVEQITGQHIDHIAKIKFGGLKNVVDAIGGVNLCYDQTVNDADSGLNWTAGCHVADGGTALAFSRMRYSDANGDFGRAQRQRQVIAAIVKKASSKEVIANPAKAMKVADAGLTALTVDDKTSPFTLVQMAFAFRAATGSKGVTGSVYWTNPDYQVSGVGSSVLLDDSRNTELFAQLAKGSHKAGTVGTLAEGTSSNS